MPVRLESDVEKRVVKAAAKKGWWPLKLACIGHRGFPDRWLIKPGPVIVIIEFKAPGKRARKLQDYVCSKLEHLGFEVHKEIDNYGEAMRILEAAQLPTEGYENNDAASKSGVIS
jgi:hypothetical protein